MSTCRGWLHRLFGTEHGLAHCRCLILQKMPKFGAARDQPTLAFIAGGVSSSEGRERITLRLSALAMFIADNELELPPTFYLP